MRSTKGKKYVRSRTRRSLIWLTYIGFACRVLIPAGYMPAPFAEGGPIVLCHGGLSGKVFARIATEAHGHHSPPHVGADLSTDDADTGEDGGLHKAWELCPVGATLKASALTAEFNVQILHLSHSVPTSEAVVVVSAALTQSYWARAPPSIYSNVA